MPNHPLQHKLSLIHSGNYGTIYHFTENGQTFALKVFAQDDKEAIHSAQNEIAIFQYINQSPSPHLMKMINAYKNPCAISMEFASGGNLRDYISGWGLYLRGIAYSTLGHEAHLILEKLNYFLQIVQGIKALHDLGILHRDIKPENVVLQYKNGEWIAVIADFGTAAFSRHANKLLSVHHSSHHENSDHPLTYGCVTTPIYAAPEVFNKNGAKYSQGSDVYALAILCYVLFSGDFNFLKNTYAIPDLHALFERLQDKTFRPKIDDLAIPVDLKQLMTTMWDQQTDKRSSPSQVINTIREMMEFVY
jgi:serine/threonine protein kinase